MHIYYIIQSEDVERMAVGDITILDAVPTRLTMRPDIDHDSNYLTTRFQKTILYGQLISKICII